MSYFVYRSLTPDESRIRLVRILPPQSTLGDPHALESGPVECTIFHVELKSAPEYTALSYTWGGLACPDEIRINERLHKVTANLNLALRHLRRRDQPVTVWVDALCIDQDDDVEKSEQLEQMRQIYSRATTVTAWLGGEQDGSSTAMQWIQLYGSRASSLGIGTKPALQLRRLLQKFQSPSDEFGQTDLGVFVEEIKTQLMGTKSSHLTHSLSKLLLRPYWSRVWVVQELVSASNITFACGDKVATEEAVHHAFRLLRNFRRHCVLTGSEIEPGNVQDSILSINTHDSICLLKLRRAAGPFPFMYLARTLRKFKASDPRDKVFALLSIAGDAGELGLRPNYRKTCDEVYTEAANALLQHGRFDVLSFCEMFQKTIRLPSWAPDWSAAIIRAPFQQRSLQRASRPLRTILEPPFAASDPSDGAYLLNEIRRADAGLSVKVLKLGNIERLGSAWEKSNVAIWLSELEMFFQLCSNASTSAIEIRDAAWRSAVADQDIRQGTSKARLGRSILDLLHSSLKDVPFSELTVDRLMSSGFGHYYEELKTLAPGRRPLYGSSGVVGIGPQESMIGDLLVILLGNQVPSVLRPQTRDKWIFIGDAYLFGAMDGEMSESNHSIEYLNLW